MPLQYPAFDELRLSFPQQYVAHVEINRPSKLNAISPPMWPALRQIFQTLDGDSDVRAVVVSGAGDRAFTAGLDVQAASTEGPLAPDATGATQDPARKAFVLRQFIVEIQANVSAIAACRKPVIFAMHGYAYGAAIDLSTCGDVRLATRDVRFCVKEVDIGLAADVGTLSRLPKLGCSLSWVKELAYTAREFGADEALRHGFVSHVYDTKAAMLEAALQLANLIATKSPVAVQGTKHLIDYSRDHAIQDGLDYTATWNAAMLQTGDVQAAMLSGLRKQTVTFPKL